MDKHTHESITIEVITILAEVSGISQEDLIDALVTNNGSFMEAEIDSLELLDALFEINHTFNVHLPQDDWSRQFTGPNARDANNLRLYTLPSVVTEIQKQLAAQPELVS